MCVCLASLICRTATCVQLPKTRWVIRSHVYCSVPRECSLLSSLAHSFKSTFRPLIRPTHYFHWLFRRFSDILSVLSLNDYHNTLNLQGYMLYLTHTCISLSLSLSFFLSFSLSLRGAVVTLECVEKLIRKDMIDPINGEKLKEKDIIVLQRVRECLHMCR